VVRAGSKKIIRDTFPEEAPLPQQLPCRIKRDQLDPLFPEVLARAFEPVDQGDDLGDPRAARAHRAHRLHHRAALGGDVVEQDDGRAGREIAVDLLLGAVVLDLLAHDEAGDGAAVPAARAHGDDDRHRAQLQAADRIDVALVSDEVADELGDEMRPLGVEHRRLHVEVVVAHRAGHELELAEEERFCLDDLEEPRLRLRERGRVFLARCGALIGAARGDHGGSRWHGVRALPLTAVSIAARSLCQPPGRQKAFRSESTGYGQWVVMAGLVPAIHVFCASEKRRRGCPAQGRA
jgi:hypothetical protein